MAEFYTLYLKKRNEVKRRANGSTNQSRAQYPGITFLNRSVKPAKLATLTSSVVSYLLWNPVKLIMLCMATSDRWMSNFSGVKVEGIQLPRKVTLQPAAIWKEKLKLYRNP